MSYKLDSSKLSNIIAKATQETIEQIEKIAPLNDGSKLDTISIHLNGKEIKLSKEDYDNLNLRNIEIRNKMKESIKELTSQLKDDIKNQKAPLKTKP